MLIHRIEYNNQLLQGQEILQKKKKEIATKSQFSQTAKNNEIIENSSNSLFELYITLCCINYHGVRRIPE